MSDPFSPSTTSPSFDADRLRASLRTVLEPAWADRAAEQILNSADQVSALREVAAQLARDRYLARLSSRFRRSLIPDAIAPRTALALVANVGLAIDGDRLEDGFGLDSVDLGKDLLVARGQYGEIPRTACPDLTWLIGRYRDSSLPASDRLSLLSHLQGCDGCRATLDVAQQADSALLAAIDCEAETLPPRIAQTGRTWQDRLGPAVFGSAVVALLMVALVAGSFVSGLFKPEHEPVPLFEGEPGEVPQLDGWLLQVSPVGFLEAIDLSTGYKRGLDSGDLSGGFSPLYRVSRTHIASWRPSDGQRDDALTIGRIGEQFSFRMTWNRQVVYWYPSGWLDDDTLLLVKSPNHIPGETERKYIERLTNESQLIAFDAVSGEQTVLLTGNVSAAFPSPDSTMLAIYQPYDHRWPGATVELRPIDGQTVGEPVVRIENRVIGEGIWLADSSAYVATVVDDATISQDEVRQARTLSSHGVERVALERIDRDGTRTTLTTTSVPESIIPLVSTPDGRSVVYQVRNDPSDRSANTTAEWRCYWIDITVGEARLLTTGAAPERVFRPTWSPDGETMILPVARAFPLAADAALDQPVNPNATTLLVFGPDWSPGDPEVVRYSSGRDLYGWLPPEAFDARAADTSTEGRSLAAVAPDAVEFDRLLIDGAVSEGGNYLLVVDRQTQAPMAWSAGNERPRRLVDGATDRSWFNNGTVAMAVVSAQEVEAGSRIVLNAADITRSAAYLDYRFFDPAAIESATDRHYAVPLVSPNGSIMSFFVVDQQRGEITLWLDDGRRPAVIVGNWPFPADGAIVPRLVASWVAPNTLLVAVPGDWRDGLPTSSVLTRLVVAPDGQYRLEELTRMDSVGSSAGVELVEFALSTDRSQIAYRLRSTDADGGTEDTIHVATTDDLSRAIEVERGGNSEGLLWTVDGGSVVAIARGRVARYAPDGRSREYLSPRGVEATDPVLVGNQIWFNGADDRGSRIWTIDLE